MGMFAGALVNLYTHDIRAPRDGLPEHIEFRLNGFTIGLGTVEAARDHQFLFSEGIEDWDSGQFEVLDIAGDYGHAVHSRRCRDERVDYREGPRVLLTAPIGGDREGDREYPVLEPGLQVLEPALEGGGLTLVSPAANSGDPLPDLPYGQHGDVQPAWGCGRDPADYACRRLALAGFR